MGKICDWLKTNKLSLNALKAEYMIIGPNQYVHKTASWIPVRVDSAFIRQVNKSRYLGLIVDDRLSWYDLELFKHFLLHTDFVFHIN